jgi:hypothetical protein
MNPGVPNWDAYDQPLSQRTRILGIPPLAASPSVLVGRSGKPNGR